MPFLFPFGSFDFTKIIARSIVFIIAIVVHEYAHGIVAYKLGDPTAKYAGRLSLNPLSHLDVIGAVCLIVFGFGWAKPVPINPMYFKDRKRDSAWVSLAGPLANIMLALLFTVLIGVYWAYSPAHFTGTSGFITILLEQLVATNVGFAVFNLIPIPPLDGSKILGAFLSNSAYYRYMRYEHFGFPLLIILSVTGVLGSFLQMFIVPICNGLSYLAMYVCTLFM